MASSLVLALAVTSGPAVAEDGVAPGFSLSVVTDQVPNARQMAETGLACCWWDRDRLAICTR